MMKRLLALVLALVTVTLCLTACSNGELDEGAYIRMYLSEPVYDLDPLTAFDNQAALQVISLLFEPLFYADENGEPQPALVESYEYIKDEEAGKYALQLNLRSTCWSDGTSVTANDVQFAFRRLFYSDVSHPATALLYDVKNARDIAEGDQSVDHLAVSVVNNTTVEIEFEKDIDVDDFLVTLCSPALIPLRDYIVESNADWAKSRSTLICSGPFQMRSMNWTEADGFILERNAYYYRDRTKDDIDKYVSPFRIIVDYATDPAEQFKLFDSNEKGAIYYFGHIPLSVRKDGSFEKLLKKVDVTDAASTHVYYLNQNAIIGDKALFADASVRKALSLAIGRDLIVETLVYARAAEGLVPYTVLNRPDKSTEFRKKAESYLSASEQVAEAKKLLDEAGINPAAYSFSITVFAENEVHMEIAELVEAAWKSIGFKNVSINSLGVEEIYKLVDHDSNPETEMRNEPTGMYNNLYAEALQNGDFEVIALDLVATSPDAFSCLAPFATAFSGNAVNMNKAENPDYAPTPHITGYASEAYNAKIEEAYNAEKNKDTAKLLHEAEAILMEDMPVIPIVHNQNATLKSSKLKGVDAQFFCAGFFIDTTLSGYWKIALRDGFLTQEEIDAAEAAAKAAKKAEKEKKKAAKNK